MSYSFITMYEVLKGLAVPAQPTDGPWARMHRWTISRHLWGAETSTGFYNAWRQHPQFIVEGFTMLEISKALRPEDVDEFARILLTLYVVLPFFIFSSTFSASPPLSLDP